MASSASQSLSDYEIYEEIGRGRHSTVYRGRKHFTLDFVAVKSIDREHSQRIKYQVSILKQMSHENIMKFFTWYQTPNNIWVCMEYCVGGSLANLLKQDRQLPEPCLRLFAKDIACGLQYVHSKQIVYCDLKPSNILLTEFAVLKLCDFGLARNLKDGPSDENVPRSKRGTPHYMSPEQFNSKAVFSVASDIWSFGCLLYEMACGQVPFPQWPMRELVKEIRNSAPPQMPSHVSPEFVDLVTRCLQKSVSKRITWPEICSHPFWESPLPLLIEHKRESLAPLALSDVSSIHNTPTQAVSAGNDRDEERTNAELNSTSNSLDSDQEHSNPKTEDDEDDDVDTEDDELLQTLRPSSTSNGSVVIGGDAEQRPAVAAPGTNRRQTISVLPLAEKPLTVGDLMEHECDVMVRPLVGNTRIEKMPSMVFVATTLPFAALDIESILSLQHTDLERFLKDVYRALDRKGTNSAERLNVLKYFIPLCTNTGFANCVINSGIMSMLIQQAGNEPQPELKMYFIHAMGTLIRYASYIGAHLASASIFEVLANLSRSPNAKIRRHAVATLGELLFYVATQEPNAQVNAPGAPSSDVAPRRDENNNWAIPACAIGTVIRGLRAGEDNVVRHYAAKTIENVAAQSPGSAIEWFATPEIVLALVQIFQSTTHKALRVTSAAALSQLLRRSSTTLFKRVLPRFGWLFLIGGLEIDSAKCQQAFFNMLLSAIANEIAPLDFDPIILIEYSIHIIENATSLIRAKALLTLALIFTKHVDHFAYLRFAFSHKLNNALERTAKDKDDYVQKAAAFLVQSVTAAVQSLIEAVATACLSSDISSALTPKQIVAFPVILSCATSPHLKHAAITAQSVQWLSRLITNRSAPGKAASPISISDVLCIVDALASDTDLLTSGAIPGRIVQHLLPSLISLIRPKIGVSNPELSSEENFSDGTRFFCIKLITDILSTLLPSLYDRGHLLNQMRSSTTSALHSLMMKEILPLIPGILNEKDPIPQYGIRLLSVMVDANLDLVSSLESIGILPLFIDLLSDREQVTLGNVKIVSAIVRSGHVDLSWLYGLDLVPKLNSVLSYSFGRSADLLSDPVLDIILHLLQHEPRNESIEALLDNAEFLLSLMLSNDAILCEKATTCVQYLVQRYPEAHFILWSSTMALSSLGNALANPRSTPGAIASILQTVSCLAISGDTRVAASLRSHRASDLHRSLRSVQDRPDLDRDVARMARDLLESIK
ncbi:Protein kinase domain-containing protein [Plasmodiophora brassicae]